MEAHWISSFTGNPVDLCRPCLWSPQRPHWEVPEKFQRSTSFDAVHLVILSTVDGPPILWGWNWWTRFNSLDLKLMHLGMIWWLPDSWDNGFQVRWRNWEVFPGIGDEDIIYVVNTCRIECNWRVHFEITNREPSVHSNISFWGVNYGDVQVATQKGWTIACFGIRFRKTDDWWMVARTLSLAAPIPDVTPSPKNSPPFKISPIQ